MKQDKLIANAARCRHTPGDCARWVGFRSLAVCAVVGALGLTTSQMASAGCPGYMAPSTDNTGPQFMRAVYQPANALAAEFTRVNSEAIGTPSIVGLWKVEFLAKGNTNGIPDGALIDFGTATWHEDGTEAMVSGGRHPADGDVCMGVWQQVGRSTFQLVHVALAWQSGAYLGPATILERVTVDGTGNSFQGSFTITQYAASMAPGVEFDESTVVPPTPINGVIKGSRVSAR